MVVNGKKRKKNYPGFNIPYDCVSLHKIYRTEKKIDILFLLDKLFTSKTKELYYQEN